MTDQHDGSNSLYEWDDTWDDSASLPVVNPSTGMPMVGNNIGGFDVGGSPYGQDIHHIPWP